MLGSADSGRREMLVKSDQTDGTIEHSYDLIVGGYAEPGKTALQRGHLHVKGAGVTWHALQSLTSVPNPSFTTMSRDRRYLYAVSEAGEGRVAALSIRDGPPFLELLNTVPAGGTGPCHLALDDSGRFLFVANYLGGSVSVLAVEPDGQLRGPLAVASGADLPLGPRRDRQDQAHPHQVVPVGGDRLLVPDLGADAVVLYRVGGDGSLVQEAVTPLDPGSGPRHLLIGCGATRAWVLNELASTVTICEYSPDTFRLQPIRSVSTLPEDFSGENTTAELLLAPSGRDLYASNRGHDSIVRFAVDEAGGLTAVDWTPTGGLTPRHFSVTPDGRYLIVANQGSNTVRVFVIGEDGGLKDTGGSFAAARPAYVQAIG
jgi:6-phosphogluconolactonase